MAGLSIRALTKLEAGFSPQRFGAGCLLLLLSCWQLAAANDSVNAILEATEAPAGVVFEIVEDDEEILEELMPQVLDAIERIRARFPQTEFAVVSHGLEEFALQTRYRDDYADLHRQVQALVADDVPVHVCETHAGWYGVSAQDFPDYVDVAPTGPGQLNLYLDLDYQLVVIEPAE